MTNLTAPMEVNVPVENLERLMAHVATLNKRAKRLGCTPLTVFTGNRFMQKVGVDVKGPNGPHRHEYTTEIVPVKLFGDAPKLNGWRLVAVVNFLERGAAPLVKVLPGETVPASFRDANGFCEHCRTDRWRKDVFVCLNETTGKFIQVGRNCVQDFLGADVNSLLARAGILASLDLRDFESVGMGNRMLTNEFMAAAACSTRIDGFHKSASEFPTKHRVQHILSTNPPKNTPKIEQQDREFATAAIEWAANQDSATCSDYYASLRAVALCLAIDERAYGIAASLPQAYRRHLGEQAEKAQAVANPSAFVGTSGQRVDMSLIVTRIFAVPGWEFFIVNMKDDEGNVLVWKTSNKGDLVEGTRYAVRGTIKAHKTYQGTKQTELSRCKFTATA